MRLIDADALLDSLDCGDRDLWTKYTVDEAPTIDAVPVCRCKDCKHLRESLYHKGETTCPMWGAVGLNPLGFCNLGERKDGEG